MSATMTEQYIAGTAQSDPQPVPTTIKTSMIFPASSSYSKSTTSTNPSLEEDESNDTSSEPLEPLTPATSVALTNPFESYTKSPPEPPSHMPPPPPSPTTVDSPSNTQAMPRADDTTPQPKQGLRKRATTFFKNHLTRTQSNSSDDPRVDLSKQDFPALTHQKSASAMRQKQKYPPIKTNLQPPPIPSAPSQAIDAASNPKIRRFSSWSLSAARSSPRSSQSNSPPSPGSPTSTIPSETHKGSPPKPAPAPPAPRLTWAGQLGNGKSKKSGPRYQRRRSASTEQVPRIGDGDEDDPTVGLMGTFSKPAMQGAGLKARRLSTNLPNEFWVDHCDLEKEFKSSSFVPGKRGRRCGKGATAEVRIMTRRQTTSEDLVAVKEFRQRDSHEDEHDYIQKIKSEFSIAKSLHHPNIVETVRLCTSQGRWNHVMEYAHHGELFALVERGLFRTHYKLQDRLCFFKQMLQGIEYLHSHGIAHRDIKLENLLLDKNGHIRITDFGVSEVFSGEHPGLRAAAGECGKNMGEVKRCTPGICGSLPYIAPEVLEKKDDYDPRPLDVWSCAIAFLTMTFGGSPWQAAQPSHPHYARYKKGWDDWLPTHPEAEVKDEVDGHPKCGPLFNHLDCPAIKRLMLKMLHPFPEKRITISEVLSSSYVKKIECCCPDNYEDTKKCCINAATKKGSTKITIRPKHHHIPPKPESKVKQAMQHRFDMGDGWN